MKWYLLALKKYSVFTGRSRRKEFWMFVLFHLIFTVVARIVDNVTGLSFAHSSANLGAGYISLLYSLAVFVPSLALTVRRFHDIGKSGWVYFRYILVTFLVCMFYVFYVVFLIMKNGGFEASLFTGTFAVISILFVLFVIIMTIWMLILLARDGQKGTNKYGIDPKEGELAPQESDVL